MGAERDSAGPEGSGLTGGGRQGGMEDSAAMGDRMGSAEVHTGLHSGRGAGEEYGGLGFSDGSGGVKDRVAGAARSAADTVRGRAGEMAGAVRDRAETLGHRAGEAASHARDRVTRLSERTNDVLQQRGLLSRLEENPLPALGVAFGLGFLLAGTGSSRADTPAGRARRELRNALMAGLTAGAAQATRGFIQSTGGAEGIFSAVTGGRGSRSSSTSGMAGEGARGRMSGGLAGADERPPSHREDL